ncbi:MAG: hypothetical protein QM711_13135 [Micropruina sp.]|uniref:hypothetical protein n=1 Tax=Micropruina sp. TaxID=2737536 RepID=UPI0039E25BE8
MPVRLTRDLNAEGMDSGTIRRMVRDQELFRTRRGAFAVQLDEGARRHLQLIQATVPRLGPDNVLSHISAAVLHGLPVDARLLDRVTVTQPSRGASSIGRYTHRYRTPLPEQDVEVVDGLSRTMLARTVFDLGRGIDLGFSGESLSRVTLWRLGLPAPELQIEIAVRGHGKTKYANLLRPGETAADVVMREKRREANLRAAGWRVVRWTYADVLNPERLDGLVRPDC